MLSSAILFVPARRLTGPVKVNSLFSLVPNADPVMVTGKALINQITEIHISSYYESTLEKHT